MFYFNETDCLFTIKNIHVNSKDNSGFILFFHTEIIHLGNQNLIKYQYPDYYNEKQGYQYLLQLKFMKCPLGKNKIE